MIIRIPRAGGHPRSVASGGQRAAARLTGRGRLTAGPGSSR